MFWKKKATDKYSLTFTKKDKRNSFRYYPEKKDRLYAIINEKEFEILNISAGGLAFSADSFNGGDIHSININFPGSAYCAIECEIEVISAIDGVCRGKFINIGDEEIEVLHRFVFEEQLKKIRENRIKYREEHFKTGRDFNNNR